MSDQQFVRSIGLMTKEKFEVIKDKRILLIGLGGVGGTCLEALVRTGFQHFVIIDCDIVEPSNLNRQILFNESDIGKEKVFAAKEHILQINSKLDIQTINIQISAEKAHILDEINFDYLIDAIDDIPAKVFLIQYALDHDKPFVSSLGMANRFDPSRVMITKLDKATGDPLAKKFRYELKQKQIDIKKVNVCFSQEPPLKDGINLNSIMLPPSSAGLNIAYHVLSHFIKN